MTALLDSAGAFAGDSLGLIAETGRAVAVFDEALARSRALEIPYPADAIDSVVIAGMGGSAIAGDLLIGAFWDRLRKPVQVVRGYSLPGWAGERTLVIGSTFSGTTEETLTCTMDAVDRTCPAIGVSTGGKMTAFYRPQGVPVVEPPASPMPRAAGVQMLACLLVICERMGVLPALDADLAEGRERLQAAVAAYGPEVPVADNPAKQVAGHLEGKLPLIWGAQMTAPIAYRWKCQINENANLPAFDAAFPEHNHNEIVGMEGFPGLGVRPHVVILRDPRQHRQIERRFGVAADLLAPYIDGVTQVTADGRTDLARLLDLVLLGDYGSMYLAVLRHVDPGPIELIGRLKDGLANTGYGRSPDPQAGM